MSIRRFLAAYEKVVPDTDVARTWFDAARRYAECIDPLSMPAQVAKVLEPSDEALEAVHRGGS